MTNAPIRSPRGTLSLMFAVGMALLVTSPVLAQTVIYNSNGFENPPFNQGPLASFYLGGTGGQDGWLTTDLSGVVTPANGAGQVQTANVFAGTQSLAIIGSRLQNDTTFSAQTCWFRNFPTFATAFNPVASGNPFVIINTRQFVASTLPTTEMPFVGVYMEGYTSTGTQQALTSIFRNANGGATVLGPGGGAFNTPDGIWSANTYHNVTATLDFANQRFSVQLDGNTLSLTPAGGGTAVTTVGFRNSNGPTERIAEYGFQASFNTQSGTNTNNAFFDNYTLSASPVPEPA